MSNILLQNTDITIFENESSDLNKCYGPTKCVQLNRFAVASKYYQMVLADTTMEMTTKQKAELLTHFHDNIYKNAFLNDYIHIVQSHKDPKQILEIQKELATKHNIQPCNISNCNTIRRHYRERGIVTHDINDSIQDPKYEYYCDYYDNFHHLIFHLFKMGLRSMPAADIDDGLETKENDNDTGTDISIVDESFQTKRDLIAKQKKQYQIDSFNERYNDTNNKFNILISNTKNEESENTFLDGMFSHVQEENKSVDVNAINKYIKDNEYDSDAFKYDLLQLSSSNICRNTGFDICYTAISNYIRNIELSSVSFATGYIFFYWEYYKNKAKESKQVAFYDDMHKHNIYNGNSLADLLISPHYDSLKDEILSSGFVPLSQWKQNVIFKANEYIQSNRAKKMKWSSACDQEYDVATSVGVFTPISVYHLQCIIMYCDFTTLCTHFSGTFRKKNQFESLVSLKARHKKYANFARGLVEIVHAFGINGGAGDISYRDGEQGPFYTGLSCVLNVPSFALYLLGPCSTTKNIEISLNFAKRRGCILALQNDTFSGLQKFFDTSWISNFSEENERLFVAEEHPLRLQSVRIIDTAKNFETLCKGLFMFDAMLSTQSVRSRWKISKLDIRFLKMLINQKLNVGKNVKLDPYIIGCFDLFLAKKTQIEISMVCLDDYWRAATHLIFHKFVNDKKNEEEKNENDNVIKTEILQIFPMLQEVVISDNRGEYSFNLLSFLKSIEKAKSSIKYSIKGAYGDSWISKKLTSEIQESYNEKNWYIKQETRSGCPVILISTNESDLELTYQIEDVCVTQ